VEGAGVVAIESEHFTAKKDAGNSRWIRIEDYGRTLSGMRATSLADAPRAIPGKDSPCLEYRMFLFSAGSFDVVTATAPTLNFIPGRGLQFAVSIDEESPRTVEIVGADVNSQDFSRDWARSVVDNARYAHTKLRFAKPGYHTLKFWMIDPGVVIEKIVVNTGGLRASYLGPPESFHASQAAGGG
jgi:hypothetical protein